MGHALSTPQTRNPLEILSQFENVLIIDDSSSMGVNRWKQTGSTLIELIAAITQYDTSGVDIHFFNSKVIGRKINNVADAAQLLAKVRISRGKPIAIKLQELISIYLDRLESGENVKFVHYIVVTDGDLTEDERLKLESVVAVAAKRLDLDSHPASQVGIQFVQVGTDETAAGVLKDLDNELKNRYRIRDIVDTTRVELGKNLDLVKMLLGALDRRIDDAEEVVRRKHQRHIHIRPPSVTNLLNKK